MNQGALASYLQEYSVHLECIGGAARGHRFKLETGCITLGSGPASSLLLEAPGIEREHATIEFWGAAFVLREIDPTRPPTLNGHICRCRELRDGDVKTACQQACPASAIEFGNLRDASSRVARAKADRRNYALLDELNTKPRTTYLSKVRNPNPDLAGEGAA